MTANLSHADVAKLLADPSASTRATLATKVASQVSTEQLTSDERTLAEDIVRAMAQDTSKIVREALSVNLKATPNLPHDVALTLANDIDSVALPILEFSEVLSEADLVELVRGDERSESKQTAIARRGDITDTVAQAIVDTTDSAAVVGVLVANPAADLSETTLDRVVDRFGDEEEVQGPLVHRQTLPLAIAERLVARLSDDLQNYLVAHHDLAPDTASKLLEATRERATINLVGDETDEEALSRMIEQLHCNGRLTPSLVLRSLCSGDLMFFETALARLARISPMNARILIHDGGELGLKSIYTKASLPESLLPAVQIALEVLDDTGFQERDFDRDSFSRMMLERILTRCEELTAEDADYLLSKLNDIAPPAWLVA